ncbi:Uncharacterized protein Fot_23123 [Forsythia ovata]|uniref:FLZ-type domain-containing protein n=1 Tax=Forsythia ovata TaxID=205694 RepID=A0ABD1UZN5_9LAMI
MTGHVPGLVMLIGETIKARDSINIAMFQQGYFCSTRCSNFNSRLMVYHSQGPKPEETTTTSLGGAGSIFDAKPSGQTSSTSKVSTNKCKNYAIVAGLVEEEEENRVKDKREKDRRDQLSLLALLPYYSQLPFLE